MLDQRTTEQGSPVIGQASSNDDAPFKTAGDRIRSRNKFVAAYIKIAFDLGFKFVAMLQFVSEDHERFSKTELFDIELLRDRLSGIFDKARGIQS